MLTGKLPFKGDYEAAILYDIVHANPESVQSSKPEVPQKLVEIVDHCLEKDKSKRYLSTSEIIEDLKSLQSDSKIIEESGSSNNRASQPVPASIDNSDPQSEKKRNRKKLILFASSLTVIVLIISFFFFSDKSDSDVVITDTKMLVVLPFKESW